MKAELHILASGSSANSYILSAGDERLVLECGVTDKDVLKSLDYNLEGVSGVLVSHSHRP